MPREWRPDQIGVLQTDNAVTKDHKAQATLTALADGNLNTEIKQIINMSRKKTQTVKNVVTPYIGGLCRQGINLPLFFL